MEGAPCMIVMIAGPRDLFVPVERVEEAVRRSGFVVDVHVNGMADGVDRCARRWARLNDLYVIPLDARWHYWREKGRVGYAGPERNEIGSRISDALIILKRPDVWTKGTTSVYRYFQGKPVYVEIIQEGDEI
jgi:hypothetical protein